MHTDRHHIHLEYEGVIHEHQDLPILVPDNDIEADFIIDWIRRELRDDLQIKSDLTPESIGHFYKTCSYINHYSDGHFFFDPKGKKEKHDHLDVCFLIHPFKAIDLQTISDRFDYELIWQQFGVAYSLYESTIIEQLMRQVHLSCNVKLCLAIKSIR